MSERNENHDPADVLTGEDVQLEEEPFVDGVANTVEDAVDEAAPALTEDPPVPDTASDSEAAEGSEAPADIPEEPAPPAEEPEEPVVDPTPLEGDFPETSRVDTASAEDLADSTSVLDTDFSAPPAEEIEEVPRDVLQGRAAQAVVGEDGQSLVALEQADSAPPEEPLDDRVDTTVMRRSLINQPPEAAPLEPRADEAPAADAAAETMFAPVTQPVTPPAPSEPIFPSRSEARGDSGLLEGATILPTVPSRAGARWLSAIGTILLVPIAWYLLTDSAVRLVLAVDNPWATGRVNPAALGEMAGGLAILLLIAILAAQSSLGLFLAGTGLIVGGLPFLIVPGMTSNTLETYLSEPLSRLGSFGQNVYFHLTVTGASGILLMAGFALMLGGWVAFRLRRTGRGEESLRAEVAAINPDGIGARWARRATERASHQPK